jgi:hypothetical protein
LSPAVCATASFEGAQDVAFDGLFREAEMNCDGTLAHAVKAVEQKGFTAGLGQGEAASSARSGQSTCRRLRTWRWS